MRLRLRLAAVASLVLLTSCEAPLSIAERGILPTPGPGQNDVSSPATVLAPQRPPRAMEQLGQAATLAATMPTGRTLPVVTGDQLARLNYVDMPIAAVAGDVIRDIMGMTADIDPAVQGRMTLQTPDRVPVSQVPRLLDQALRPYGFGIALINGRVRVGRVGELSGTSGGQDGSITLRPRQVDTASLIAALQPALAGQVRLAPADNNTAIVATGPAPALASLQSLLDLFDTGTLAGRSFGIYPLSHASPTTVARELTAVAGPKSGVVFEPVQRLNAVLVVAGDPRGLAWSRKLITDLDVQSAATSFVHVRPIINRRAGDVAEVLTRIFGTQQGPATPRAPPGGAFGQLSVGSASSSSSSLGVRVPGMGQGITQATTPPLAPAPGMPSGSEVLLGPLDAASQATAGTGLSGPVRVQPDPGRNALVILASPSDYRIIEQAIGALDVRPRQVLIEAVIAEVQLTDGLQFGLDALFSDSNNTASLQSGVGPLATLLSATPATGALGQGLAYVFHNKNVTVIVKALSTLVNVNVVSAPRVLVLDNEVATLQVGDQVPILTQQQQSTDNPNAPLVNSVQMRDTGVILSVTPRIGAGGNLSLDIFQEVSQPTQNTFSNISSPTIALRRIESSVNMETGDTIAIGGLMQDQALRQKAGIPFLNSIPFLGWLFGSWNNQVKRTELLVLLNPRIVSQEAQAQVLTEELREKLQSIAPTLAPRTVPPAPLPKGTVPPARLPATPTGPSQFFR